MHVCPAFPQLLSTTSFICQKPLGVPVCKTKKTGDFTPGLEATAAASVHFLVSMADEEAFLCFPSPEQPH